MRRTASNAGPYFSTVTFEDQIVTRLESYLLSLRRADATLPAYVMVAGTRMSGYVFFNPHLPIPAQLQPLPDHFQLPTILIEDYAFESFKGLSFNRQRNSQSSRL
jgi:hypothetical protein